ncbi:MAG: aminotransferase class I/II-fold pyridoxal phosphate-dependent enzyme [Thermoplasmata archaeon]|jgi:histidinol-phosphate aminotransferase|nr:aminotransferase class I/II-fold pyridoxal phosphate-dependent enzyme [Thermoplasmata archaeon]
MTSIGELRRRTLESISRPSYSLNRQDMVLLNDNANLYGANPAVKEVAESFDFSRLWAYPSENSDRLRARLASEFGVSPDEVIVGNGSDELLDMISKAFLNPGDILTSPAPTFAMYKFYAKVNLAEVHEKLLRQDFTLDATPLIAERAKLTAVCQPNNPTANLFDVAEVRRLLSDTVGIVLVDEAYSDFCGSNMMMEVLGCERGIDIRTFSKAYGMAGLRAGFAVARKEIVDEVRRVRTPFGLNSFTEAVAIGAMDDRDWVRRTVDRMVADRGYLSERMSQLGFDVRPSVCNFVIAKVPVDGPGFVTSLKERGVAVRDCSQFQMMKDFVRVTVGPRPLLDRFLAEAEPLIRGGAR